MPLRSDADAPTGAIGALLRLAARPCGAPVQLCVFEGPAASSQTTDPRAPDLSGFAREVVEKAALTWGLTRFGASAPADVVGAPVICAGRAIGAVCAFGPVDAEAAEAALSDVALLIGRECEQLGAGNPQAPSAEARAVPAAMLEIMDSAPVAMALYDCDLTILKVNDRWGFDFGLRPERMVGRTLYEIDPATKGWETQYKNCLKGERLVSDRAPIQLKDGRMAYLSAITIPWRRTDGEIGGLLGMYRMSADNSADEYALGEAQRRLETAVKLGGVHIWEMNYRTQSIWGMGYEEAGSDSVVGFLDLSKDMAAGVHPDDHAVVAEEIAKARKESRPYFGEHRMDRKDRELWVSSAAADFYGEDGELETRLAVSLDITRRKQAERALVEAVAEAEAANRAKSDFLATMSHEIRTPLNGVLGMARAMAAGELSPVQRERLEVVRQSGESLLALLNDVLDLSKVEAGKLELEAAPFDISDLARGVHATFESLAEAKGLAFELIVEDAARGVYLGDVTRVRQILSNLISNAVKFTDQGAVRVTISRSRRGLVMRVRDSGIGIPSDRVGKLFRKFEQADASTTRRYGGTGLGLAICREFAERMGGTIKVTSKAGGGSTFTVALPLPKLDQAAAAQVESPAPQPLQEPDARPLRVLAAEDNMVNQLVLRTLLNQAGIEPTIVDDGQAALEAWEREEWDVILMDVQMPVMDGPTSAKAIRLRERASGRGPIPIIALTANVMSHQVRAYEEAGMSAWVAKPIEVGALFAALEAALDPGSEDEAPGRATA